MAGSAEGRARTPVWGSVIGGDRLEQTPLGARPVRVPAALASYGFPVHLDRFGQQAVPLHR